MNGDKQYRMETMQDFVMHPGWGMLEAWLQKRLQSAQESLAVEDLGDVGRLAYWQASVRVCREVLGEPKRVIQEGKNETDRSA